MNIKEVRKRKLKLYSVRYGKTHYLGEPKIKEKFVYAKDEIAAVQGVQDWLLKWGLLETLMWNYVFEVEEM